MSARVPDTIRFNAIDRYYLIPETDDPNGVHFPMIVGFGAELTQPLDRAHIISALRHINARYPQFRLAYRLDYHRDVWRRVPDDELDRHFASIAQEGDVQDFDTLISEAIRTNVDPLALPMHLRGDARSLVMKINHSFCDGRFAIKLMAHLLIAAFDPDAYAQMPDLPARYATSIARIVWDTPQQGFRTLYHWIRTFTDTYKDYAGGGSFDYTPEPIVSHAPMCATRVLLSAETIAALDRLRQTVHSDTHISLNTLMQIMIGHRLMALGILPSDQPITYTQPLDLKRYLRNAKVGHAGNFASQIRLRLPQRPAPDFVADLIDYQTRIDQQIHDGLALSTLPSEWLLRLTSRQFYKKVNRDWLKKSIHTDPRYFVFSNLGRMDEELQAARRFIKPSSVVALSVSLMGAPPLVLTFGMFNGEGHLTITYNPRVLNAEQIEQIKAAFTPTYIEELYEVVR